MQNKFTDTNQWCMQTSFKNIVKILRYANLQMQFNGDTLTKSGSPEFCIFWRCGIPVNDRNITKNSQPSINQN